MRIVKEIGIEGKRAKALFDAGSIHSYASRWLLEGVPIRMLSRSYRVALGGRIIEVKEHCSIEGKIEGLVFHTNSTVTVIYPQSMLPGGGRRGGKVCVAWYQW